MKIRYDFVTNSSSSSFIVNTENLTEEQIQSIFNYVEVSNTLGIDPDGWDIWEHNASGVKYLYGFTACCNGAMPELFAKLNIPAKFDDGY